MPRQVRIESAGATYHVMCRGDRREAIIGSGLAAFDLDEKELGEMKTSADGKSLIAAIVRAETSVRASWVAERLQMGSVANVTRATRAIAHRLAILANIWS